MMRKRTMPWAAACAIVLGSISGLAEAQPPEETGEDLEAAAPEAPADEPEAGEADMEPAPAPQPAAAPAPAPAEPEPEPPPAANPEPEEDGDAEGATDHEKVVGHVGVGLLGSLSVPTGGGGNLTLQTLGVRYWVMSWMGIDAGVGLGFRKNKTTQEVAGMEDTLAERTQIGFSLHGGVPLAPVSSQHFTFLIVPEMDFGFGTVKNNVDPNDPDRFGFLIRAGARVGAEIQFGFIDIPQLSLQASIGAYLAVRIEKEKDSGVDTTGTEYGFDTTAQGDPWDIFTGSLAAIYYF